MTDNAVMELDTVVPWRVYRVRASRVRRLTPHLVRVTVCGARSGDQLADFADVGADQRIKLILPPPSGDLSRLVDGPDWYLQLRQLPDDLRPVVRTYTTRAVRSGDASVPTEVDIDMVVHGVVGPASAWVSELLELATADGSVARGHGDQVALIGPSVAHGGPWGGREFVTERTDDLLLVGDETALPAIAAILEDLPSDATGQALIETPGADDVLELAAPRGFAIRWLPRDGVGHGEPMVAAALEWAPASATTAGGLEVPDPDNWDDEPWEVPADLDQSSLPTTIGQPQGIRVWVAGEAAAVRTIRRHLVGPCGLARHEVAFMGYWRIGRAES